MMSDLQDSSSVVALRERLNLKYERLGPRRFAEASGVAIPTIKALRAKGFRPKTIELFEKLDAVPLPDVAS